MSLPQQRIPFSKKNLKWQQDTINHYERLTRGSVDSNRSTFFTKRINYDLFNGKFNKADLEYVCNPLGVDNNDFPATLQHYDITSPPLNLLIGEEAKRPDNTIVVSGSMFDINRKQGVLKKKINDLLQQSLIAGIDPSTIDPNQPPPVAADILKYDKYNISDLIEAKANKILQYLKRDLNTKEVFKKGFGDALKVGEEIYWCGVSNNDVILRRCNPLNMTVILDGDSDCVDDGTAVTEVRMMTPASILDEFGDILKPIQVDEIEAIASRIGTGFAGSTMNPTFVLDKSGGVTDTGTTGFTSGYSTNGSYNTELIRVLRVEWKSMKKLYHLSYTDEQEELQELIVDESFNLKLFKDVFPDATTEEFWINEAWEGIKIHTDIFVGVQPKQNQRRRIDNPYYCKLGYTGLIYNCVNSQSVSLIDRIKPYQYLYNIFMYRLELAFAQDQGKKFIMDLAQIPRSEGISLEKWIYYLKATGIAFINSFEEGKKGTAQGKFPTYNQFQSIDLSLANTIQQYINTLEYLKQQVSFISGVTPQRLGAISNNELVGNVERSVQQSALITEYLFDAHDEVKRRVYTGLVECAKIAYRHGKKVQYILDDMGIELLDIEELELDDSEFNVFMSNSTEDKAIKEGMKSLMVEALKADKATLSMMVDSLITNSTKEMSALIKKGEEDKYARDKSVQDQQMQIEQSKIKVQQQIHAETLNEQQKERDLKQYISDSSNETKITVQEIANYFKAADTDSNENGIPDPMEIADHALAQRELDSKTFNEQAKLQLDKDKHSKEVELKNKELSNKKEIENKKIDAIKIQNKNQIDLANKQDARAEKELKAKIQIEKLKLQASKIKANKTKPKK